MTRYQLFRLLRHNQRLGFRRHPAFEQGLLARVLTFLGGFFFVAYLIIIGGALGFASRDGGIGMLTALMPFVLVIDFFLRFLVQQTPDMQAKPYILLPMSKYAVIDVFLISSLLSAYNFLWLCLPVAYALVALTLGGSAFGLLVVVISALLLILLNSQFYLLMRSLLNRSLWWWLVALPLLALPFAPLLVWDMDTVFDTYAAWGTSPLLPPAVLLAIVALAVLNRRQQFRYVYEELANTDADGHVRFAYSFSQLNRFGLVGEYLKLEIRSVMRNKVIRAKFRASMLVVVVFSALIAYTPVYDDQFSTNFWCFYCFVLYGVASLVKVMCPEGNYIDVLMAHRESILQLLRAKYYFHCALIAVPFLVMLPAVITGKFTLLMMLAYMLLAAGLVYFLLFHLAIYNSQTLLLEQKVTGKGNIENGSQLLIELAAFLLPTLLVAVLQLLFSTTVAFIIQALIGLAFIVAHPWWLRHIYRRMMRRKYVNLEGFYASR